MHGTDIVDRGLIVLFFGLFCYFRSFFRWPHPGNFSADALARLFYTKGNVTWQNIWYQMISCRISSRRLVVELTVNCCKNYAFLVKIYNKIFLRIM